MKQVLTVICMAAMSAFGAGVDSVVTTAGDQPPPFVADSSGSVSPEDINKQSAVTDTLVAEGKPALVDRANLTGVATVPVDSVSAAETTTGAVDVQKGASDQAQAGAAAPQGKNPATESEDQASVRKIKLTKRSYNYKQQIYLAVGMMAFIALIMFSAQTLNPK